MEAHDPPPACRFGQLQGKLNRFPNTSGYLLRVLPSLPIEAGIVVCVHAAFERSGVSGAVKEPRRDTQRTNPIASLPCSADFVGLAIHCRHPGAGRTLNCDPAKP